VYYGW